jgi:hypothetical protein
MADTAEAGSAVSSVPDVQLDSTVAKSAPRRPPLPQGARSSNEGNARAVTTTDESGAARSTVASPRQRRASSPPGKGPSPVLVLDEETDVVVDDDDVGPVVLDGREEGDAPSTLDVGVVRRPPTPTHPTNFSFCTVPTLSSPTHTQAHMRPRLACTHVETASFL